MKSYYLLFPTLLVFEAAATTASQAATYTTILESNLDQGDNEVVLLDQDSLTEVLDGNILGNITSTSLNIGPDYSIAGSAYDGDYLTLVERNTDSATNEVVLLRQTRAQLIAGDTLGTVINTALNIAPNYSIGGFLFDGQYRLLLEPDAATSGLDVVALTINALDDLIQGKAFTFQLQTTLIPINPAFSIGGFAYDGQYQMLLESDEDVADDETFLISFDTFDDVVQNNIASFSFTDLNISPGYSIGGFLYDGVIDDPQPPAVPLPAGLPMLLSGLGILLGVNRFRHRS